MALSRFQRRRYFGWAVFLSCAAGVIALLSSAHRGQLRLSPRPEGMDPALLPASAEASPDLRVELAAALTEKDPGQRSFRFNRLLQAWLAKDPEGVIGYLRGMPRASSEYTLGLMLALGEIAQKNPERALTLAREMVASREQAAVYNLLFAQLAQQDPARAVAALDWVPAGTGRGNALRALASTWALRDPEAALGWAKSLGVSPDRGEAMEATLVLFAKNDPARAISLAQQFLPGAAQERIMASSIAQMVRNDPATASELVSTLPAGTLKSDAVPAVARALAAQSIEAALAWNATLPIELQQVALNNTLDIWSRADPDGAVQYVQELPPGLIQNAAAGHLANALAEIDPASAAAWASSLAGAARAVADVSIASTWARSDAAAAARWAGSLPAESAGRSDAIQSAVSYWVLKDAGAAGSFVRELPEVDQTAAIAALIPVLAQSDPSAALRWAQSLPDEDNRALALDAAVNRWAANAPPAAATWVSSEPAGNAQIDHARAVMEQWIPTDPQAALAWAGSLLPGATRDGALDMASAQLARGSHALAVQVAGGISSLPLRTARLQSLGIAP